MFRDALSMVYAVTYALAIVATTGSGVRHVISSQGWFPISLSLTAFHLISSSSLFRAKITNNYEIPSSEGSSSFTKATPQRIKF